MLILISEMYFGDFPGGPMAKNLPCNAGDMDSIPDPGRSHMPWNNSLCAATAEPGELQSLCTTTRENLYKRSYMMQ